MPTEEPKRGSERGGVAPPGDALGSRTRNWLVPMMLLSIRKRESYGYELMERARALGFGATNLGTLYRTLRWMEEEDGVVESSWETE